MNTKNMQTIVILIVVVISLVIILGFFGVGGFSFSPAAVAPQDQTAASPAQQLLAQVQAQGGVSQLEGADIAVGTGDPIAPGDTIEVAYTGALPNGTVFDSTDAHGGTPLTLVVAADGTLHLPDGGGLIAGWSQGMAGMKEGGRRLLAIPPSLGYGANAQGPIPANSSLIFDVRVVKRTPAGTPVTASTTAAH
jgi:FKBP-type peptidyl-prolyl cis-trans isomerase